MQINPEIKARIVSAAEALMTEGIEEPTNDQVRQRAKASLSHVSPVMREWREARKAKVIAALDLPSELKKVIETSLSQVWTVASKLASATAETIQQEAQAEIAAATNEREEAFNEIGRLETRIADLLTVENKQKEEIQRLMSELDIAQRDVIKFQTELAALSARVEERNEQIKNLKKEMKEARDDNKSLQAELIKIARKSKKDPT